ncbi:MAG: ABC transporter substrate-binding protein [Desulfofustis sp.]|jgi:polar amino acid transport system substrate-binding protein|nr:ABC transporter substrate-binding protein [Desulfofustis sp.]
MKKLTGLFVSAVLALSVGGVLLSNAVAADKTITIGCNSENPPWVYMDNGKMTGFEVDIANEFAKRAGYTIEFKTAPFSSVLTGVQSGQWDIGMSSIWIKEERAKMMDFADPYYDSGIGLVTRTGGGVTKFEDMKGKVFGSDTGSLNEAWLIEANAKYGPYEIKSYDYWADAILDLEAGRIDGVVVDGPIALYYIVQHPQSALEMNLHIPGFSAGQAFAFKKGSPLKDEFNKIQNEMKKDGTMLAIHKKWFGSDPLPGSSTIEIVAPYFPNQKP